MEPITEHQNTSSQGVRLHFVNILMIVVAILLTFGLIYATWEISVSYDQMRAATDRYITCDQAARNLQAASDYLTAQARLYVMTGEPEKVQNYFEEVNLTRRRDRALEDVRKYLADSEAEDHLREALQLSEELKDLEITAMRLAVDGYGQNIHDFPREVRECTLSGDLASMAPDRKLTEAQKMLFDRTYQNYKDQIGSNVSLCVDDLVTDTRIMQEDSANRLFNVLRNQHILIGLLLVTVLFMVFLTTFFIILPLQKSIDRIQNHQYLPMSGSYEFRYLARTYNSMFRTSQVQHQQLSYEATHDALTGLYNRSAFNTFLEEDLGGDVSLLLIDADKFKQINDAYGHLEGDNALILVAKSLKCACGSHRKRPYIARYGGDEFIIVLEGSEGEVQALCADIRHILRSLAEDLPYPLSLTIGYARWAAPMKAKDLIAAADEELYRIKKER